MFGRKGKDKGSKWVQAGRQIKKEKKKKSEPTGSTSQSPGNNDPITSIPAPPTQAQTIGSRPMIVDPGLMDDLTRERERRPSHASAPVDHSLLHSMMTEEEPSFDPVSAAIVPVDAFDVRIEAPGPQRSSHIFDVGDAVDSILQQLYEIDDDQSEDGILSSIDQILEPVSNVVSIIPTDVFIESLIEADEPPAALPVTATGPPTRAAPPPPAAGPPASPVLAEAARQLESTVGQAESRVRLTGSRDGPMGRPLMDLDQAPPDLEMDRVPTEEEVDVVRELPRPSPSPPTIGPPDVGQTPKPGFPVDKFLTELRSRLTSERKKLDAAPDAPANEKRVTRIQHLEGRVHQLEQELDAARRAYRTAEARVAMLERQSSTPSSTAAPPVAETATPVTPRKSAPTQVQIQDIQFDEGMTYLLDDEERTTSYRAFSKFMAEGVNGIVFTSSFPRKVAERHGIEEKGIYWLSESKQGERVISPRRLDFELTQAISRTVKGDHNLIVFDGLEYLMLTNSFEAVMNFLKITIDLVSTHQATLIVPLSFSGFNPKELAIVKSRFDRVLG